jgi:hypothetical protein
MGCGSSWLLVVSANAVALTSLRRMNDTSVIIPTLIVGIRLPMAFINHAKLFSRKQSQSLAGTVFKY